MSQFTVRIELHDAVYKDYEALHSAMERAGFSRLIAGDNGRTYHLPWAEYNGSGNLSAVQVREIAQQSADSTGKRNAVLVTEAGARAWAGLAEVSA